MNWTIEVIVIPVSDVDRAKEFYHDKMGFNVDIDTQHGPSRIVQITPPGSGCSLTLMSSPEGAGGPGMSPARCGAYNWWSPT